jgi:hypothetical protein
MDMSDNSNELGEWLRDFRIRIREKLKPADNYKLLECVVELSKSATSSDNDLAAACRDMVRTGTGVMKDGKRIDPKDFFASSDVTKDELLRECADKLERGIESACATEPEWSKQDRKLVSRIKAALEQAQ